MGPSKYFHLRLFHDIELLVWSVTCIKERYDLVVCLICAVNVCGGLYQSRLWECFFFWKNISRLNTGRRYGISPFDLFLYCMWQRPSSVEDELQLDHRVVEFRFLASKFISFVSWRWRKHYEPDDILEQMLLNLCILNVDILRTS